MKVLALRKTTRMACRHYRKTKVAGYRENTQNDYAATSTALNNFLASL